MRHTPGPWRTDRPYDAPSIYVIAGEGATLTRVASVRDAHKANARLIAAAPELLEALQGLVLALPAGWSMQAARAAIAKATGEA
jgi:hypothetical protein